MSGVLSALFRTTGKFDDSPLSVETIRTGFSAFAQMSFDGEGSLNLSGTTKSPENPRWWTNSNPPTAWWSFTSTGSGLIINNMKPDTIYTVPTSIIGVYRTTTGTSTRTFTITFWADAAGTIALGTKTLVATATFL